MFKIILHETEKRESTVTRFETDQSHWITRFEIDQSHGQIHNGQS